MQPFFSLHLTLSDSWSPPLSQDSAPSYPDEILASDQAYLVHEYRVLLEVLENVKLGFTPRSDLDAAIDNYVRFKLPSKYLAKIPNRKDLEQKYRRPYLGQLESIKQRYDSEEDRQRETIKIENDVRFSAIVELLLLLKKLLEDEGVMNTFASGITESVGAPVGE